MLFTTPHNAWRELSHTLASSESITKKKNSSNHNVGSPSPSATLLGVGFLPPNATMLNVASWVVKHYNITIFLSNYYFFHSNKYTTYIFCTKFYRCRRCYGFILLMQMNQIKSRRERKRKVGKHKFLFGPLSLLTHRIVYAQMDPWSCIPCLLSPFPLFPSLSHGRALNLIMPKNRRAPYVWKEWIGIKEHIHIVMNSKKR